MKMVFMILSYRTSTLFDMSCCPLLTITRYTPGLTLPGLKVTDELSPGYRVFSATIMPLVVTSEITVTSVMSLSKSTLRISLTGIGIDPYAITFFNRIVTEIPNLPRVLHGN
jgi:hypothetical protein